MVISRRPLSAGATPEAVVEALEVAVVMGGGPALMYATRAYEALQAMRDD